MYIVHGVSGVVHGVVVYGVRCMATWCMALRYGVWCMVFGAWCMLYMVHGTYSALVYT
jgi:hypothetical protein